MKIAIIADNTSDINILTECLNDANKSVIIEAVFSSGKSALRGIKEINSFDLMIIDVDLSDISSTKMLSILQVTTLRIFLADSFEECSELFFYNAIAFIKKPISKTQIIKSIIKYDSLRRHFLSFGAAKNDAREIIKRFKNRFIARRGSDLLVVSQKNIACFYTENRIVFMITNDNQKYITENGRLSDLSTELDPLMFS